VVTNLSVCRVAAYVFFLQFWENIPTVDFGMIPAETAFWDIKDRQIFNEDFYLPLYLPLWGVQGGGGGSHAAKYVRLSRTACTYTVLSSLKWEFTETLIAS
jgi:hypothetical protein